jgi:signal transduction histidine kinase
MSIRLKVLGAIVLSFFIFFAALFIGARSIILNSFEQLEADTSHSNAQRIMNVLQDNFNAMISTNLDWGHWDEPYAFIRGESTDFVETNLGVATMSNLDLNMMLFVDSDKNLLHAEVIDREINDFMPLPEGISEWLTEGSPFLNHSEKTSIVSGFVRIPNHLIMLTSVPILMNDAQGEISGSLVLGRFFDAPEVTELAEALQFDLQMLDYASPDLSAEAQSAKASLSSDNPINTEIVNEQTIAGFALITDVRGEPIAIIQANMPRDIYQRGLGTLNLLAAVLVGAGLIMGIASALALEGIVVNRLTKLSEEVDQIQESGGQTALAKRVTVSSKDELSRLSKNINTMLDRLEYNRRQLSEQNQALKVAYQEAEEATRLKSEFLSTMSHELRTPLNAIVGYAGIMLEGVGGEIDGEARSMLENINESSEQLLKLINDILDISKIEAGRLELVSENFAVRPLIDTISSNLRVLAEQKRLSFDVDIDEKVPLLLVGDKDRLSQILINLLSNAFKFTDRGAVGLYVAWSEAGLLMRVRDTGIGIPPHAMQYIFDEFRQVDGTYSRSYAGTGLGLAIVKKLVEAMDGTVTVDSRVGEGSVFTVNLPLKASMQASVG